MRCAWQAYLNLLPPRLRQKVDDQGREELQELRLRLGRPPELILRRDSRFLTETVRQEDLRYVVNAASRFSPWSSSSAAQGYLTAPGGHRVGLCGEMTVQADGRVTGVREVSSLCLRVARDFPGIAQGAGTSGSVLILGKPGSGKTTLLRDLIRQRSQQGGSVAVVDQRGELFPRADGMDCFPPGPRTDVLTGCGKAHGLEMAIRTLGPSCVALDEITEEGDCQALLRAGWCGVDLLATAHAKSREDLLRRTVYRPLVESRIFEKVLILQPDKSWRVERMER